MLPPHRGGRSNRNLLDFIERDFARAPVVELCGARRGVVGERLGVFESALVLEVGGDAGRAEGVIADFGLDACRCAGSFGIHPVANIARAWPVLRPFRLAFPLARIWWRLTRPQHEGVVVAIYVGPALLLVR
jgi:hypothetical protein